MFNFEKLEVWHKSVAFAGPVYRATKSFPSDGRFGLTTQIRRAATSVAANIAEGSARPPADFARFISYASGSVFEVVAHAAVARNEGFLPLPEYAQLYRDADEISRMLSGLRKSLE